MLFRSGQAKRHIKAIGAEDKVVYIDVEENEALVSEYKIKNLPTFILLDFDGKEVERFVGFDKVKIDKMLDKVLKVYLSVSLTDLLSLRH